MDLYLDEDIDLNLQFDLLRLSLIREMKDVKINLLKNGHTLIVRMTNYFNGIAKFSVSAYISPATTINLDQCRYIKTFYQHKRVPFSVSFNVSDRLNQKFIKMYYESVYRRKSVNHYGLLQDNRYLLLLCVLANILHARDNDCVLNSNLALIETLQLLVDSSEKI